MYTRTVIPQIEARIEERLLHEYMRTIPNDLERKELHDAYIMRRHRLSKLPEESDSLATGDGGGNERTKLPADSILATVPRIDGTGVKYHTFADIGTYTVFPAQYRKRLFPGRVFGRIEEDEVERIETLGVMCREQGLRITNDLARLTLPSERSIDYGRVARMSA